ncbi:MAG: hypothetical protein ACE5I5_16910 [Candidatus Heimdallarchaeota archaeon]
MQLGGKFCSQYGSAI